jgi:hypothetical protein
MAVLKYHSIDESKIKRLDISIKIKIGEIINIRNKKLYTSYLNAIESGAILPPDKNLGVFAVRIAPESI